MRCIICGSLDFSPLPDPNPFQALRSDCFIEPFPLKKSHCISCGLIMAWPRPEFSYSEGYDLYSSIESAEAFDEPRKRNIMASIASAVTSAPQKIIEVGCGNGAMMQLMNERFPGALISGIEPSRFSVQEGRGKNLDITRGIAGEDLFPEFEGRYDLVYSIQVIEHTPDPLRFIAALSRLAAQGGCIAIRCPDGWTPNSELLYSDHRYSFLPHHLHKMLEESGLTVLSCGPCAAESGKDKSLMAIAVKNTGVKSPTLAKAPTQKEIADLYKARAAYLNAWADLEGFLLARLESKARVACFGAAQWASLLGCYAPEVWKRIGACFIDGSKGGKCIGKQVRDYSELSAFAPDVTVIGTNPASQPFIRNKLVNDGVVSLAWSDRIGI